MGHRVADCWFARDLVISPTAIEVGAETGVGAVETKPVFPLAMHQTAAAGRRLVTVSSGT